VAGAPGSRGCLLRKRPRHVEAAAPGTFIPSDALAGINAPVLGLYAGDDRPLTPTLAPTASKLKELRKSYESHTFAAASHAFMREQSDTTARISKRRNARGR
jgi:pimeloyl-ACP methyl ester carboxylesterase